MAQIHQTAIIGNDVELDDSVFVGPYCIIEDHVKIGENTRLIAQCHIYSNTTIGAGNMIFPFATLGGPPNDVSYDPTHQYRIHQYMLDFFADEEKQDIVRRSGARVSVGFDGHRVEDYLPDRVREFNDKLTALGIKKPFEN